MSLSTLCDGKVAVVIDSHIVSGPGLQKTPALLIIVYMFIMSLL